MLFNKNSAIQKCFQKILHSLQGRKFGSLSAVWTTCHTVRTPICPKCQPFRWRVISSGRTSPKHHPFGWRELSVRTFPGVEKFQTATACICLDVSIARMDESQCLTKLQDFFPKHSYGKIAATVRTTWSPIRRRSSIRQVSYSKSRCPDASQYGPDTRASDMEIACIKINCQNDHPLVRTREALIWKLLAKEVPPSRRQGTTVRTWLKNRREFQRNSREVDHTVVHLDGA
jgi:hypothetical protein